MDAVAADGELQSNDADVNAAGGALMCRRNALPDILDEAVTKMSTGSAVSTLTRLHSIHGLYYKYTILLLASNYWTRKRLPNRYQRCFSSSCCYY